MTLFLWGFPYHSRYSLFFALSIHYFLKCIMSHLTNSNQNKTDIMNKVIEIIYDRESKVNEQDIHDLTSILHRIYMSNQDQYVPYSKRNIQKFVNSFIPEIKDVVEDIFSYMEEISRRDIYKGISSSISKVSFSNSSVFLYNSGYYFSKSSPNFNLLFIDLLFQKSNGNLYLLYNNPDKVFFKKYHDSFDDNIPSFKNYPHQTYQFVIIDDISYSGMQLTEDLTRFRDFVFEYHTNYLNGKTCILHVFLYGITIHSLMNFQMYYTEVMSELSKLSNVRVEIQLHYTRILYSPIPIYFQYSIGENEFSRLSQYIPSNSQIGHDFQKTLRVISDIQKSPAKQKAFDIFSRFYFYDEKVEYQKFRTKRSLTLIYIDYKIPDARSINDRLFFGFIPQSLIESSKANPNDFVFVGTFDGNPVWLYRLFGAVFEQFKTKNTVIDFNNPQILHKTNLVNKSIRKTWYKTNKNISRWNRYHKNEINNNDNNNMENNAMNFE
jgi:hypothetical protein